MLTGIKISGYSIALAPNMETKIIFFMDFILFFSFMN